MTSRPLPSRGKAEQEGQQAPPPQPPTVLASIRPANSAMAEVGNSGLRRMLTALAQRPAGLTRRQLGVRAGISSGSGTFSNYLSKARTQGWLEGNTLIRITGGGRGALGPYEGLPEGRELAAYWLRALGQGGASRMLQALIAVYPDGLERAELQHQALLAESGTFSNYLSKLRSLELITGTREIKAADELIG